jgi:hypothetical protein
MLNTASTETVHDPVAGVGLLHFASWQSILPTCIFFE